MAEISYQLVSQKKLESKLRFEWSRVVQRERYGENRNKLKRNWILIQSENDRKIDIFFFQNEMNKRQKERKI